MILSRPFIKRLGQRYAESLIQNAGLRVADMPEFTEHKIYQESSPRDRRDYAISIAHTAVSILRAKGFSNAAMLQDIPRRQYA